MRGRGALWVCWIVAPLLLVGCGALRSPEVYDTVRPQTPPVRNITNFTECLRCMDELFAAYRLGDQGIGAAFVTSDGIIDHTGKGIGGANRDVVTSTISRMATQSGAYKFVRYNPRKPEDLSVVQLLYGDETNNFTWPRYEISGGVTQLDENVDVRTLGISLALPQGDLGASKDWQATIVSIDVNLDELPSGQLLNGMTASNSIAILRRGKALDGGAVIQKVGLFFNLSLDRNEGVYAAVRALIELSLIEVLGKLAKVPYWQCLQIDHTNPEVLRMTADWYATMKVAERVRFVQRILAQRGYYSGAITGLLEPGTQTAIARYQAAADLVPSGRIDLALYRQLISRDLRERVVQAQAAEGRTAPGVLTAAKPLLTLTTPRGTAPVYALNERWSFSVQVSQDGYLFCYYRDAHQRVSRLYPNRFQPQAYVRAQQVVTIPAGRDFALQLDVPHTTEAVRCVAAPEDIEGRIPAHLQRDLEALPGVSLEEAVEALRQLAPDTLAEARLEVQVR